MYHDPYAIDARIPSGSPISVPAYRLYPPPPGICKVGNRGWGLSGMFTYTQTWDPCCEMTEISATMSQVGFLPPCELLPFPLPFMSELLVVSWFV